MFYALGWLVVLSLLALWSLAVWAMHGAAVWALSNAGQLSGAASGAQTLRLPDWLAPWVPPELMQALASLIAGFAPMIDSALQAAPSLTGGLTVASWVIWGLGTVLLLALGSSVHLLLGFWRRRAGAATPPPGPQSAPL